MTRSIEVPELAEQIMTKVESAGFEIYLVGGIVRDFLMGTPTTDYDFATNALPSQLKSLFKDYTIMDYGESHGTVGVYYRGRVVEITTYRTEGRYSDGRRPDQVSFVSTLEEDLSRRDFTINALAADVEGTIVDYHGGLDDFANQLIRCVGDPVERFQEDSLRMLRAIRFSLRLSFAIEAATFNAIRNNTLLIKQHAISGERIQIELAEIMNYTGKCFDLMDLTGILVELFDRFSAPSIAQMRSYSHDLQSNQLSSWGLLGYFLRQEGRDPTTYFTKYPGYGKAPELIYAEISKWVDPLATILAVDNQASFLRLIRDSTTNLTRFPEFDMNHYVTTLVDLTAVILVEDSSIPEINVVNLVNQVQTPLPLSGSEVKEQGLDGVFIGLAMEYLRIFHLYNPLSQDEAKTLLEGLIQNRPLDLDETISIISMGTPTQLRDEIGEVLRVIDLKTTLSDSSVTYHSDYAGLIYDKYREMKEKD